MGRVSGKRGPDPLPSDELAKRRSHRTGRRRAEEAGTIQREAFPRKPSPPRAPVPGDEFAYGDPRRDALETWLPLLLLIPKWDPRAQSADCRFDGRKARRVIGWFERHVYHLTGTKRGELVRLEPFQRAFLANLFGWVYDTAAHPDPIMRALDGRRRFRKALLYCAKKNGKTTILGGLAAYAFTRLKEGGAKVLTAATHRGQARGVWEVARDTIAADPRTIAKCILWNAAIQLVRDQTAVLEPISGEAKGEDGADCFVAILDELHRQDDLRLLTILDKGGSGRAEPLFVILTTADEIRESPCNNELAYAKSVRKNAGDPNAPGWNPAYLPAVYELDEGDDWREEKNWYKANPGLGTVKSLIAMRSMFREANEREDVRVEFQRFELNLRVENAFAPIKQERWRACVGPVVESLGRPRTALEMRDAMLGRPCILGADLAEINDMVALVLWFWQDRVVLPWFFASEHAAQERFRKNQPLYLRWRDAGYLDLVKDNAIELASVLDKVGELKALYDIRHAGIDRAKAFEFEYACSQRFGLACSYIGQGWLTMTDPCDRLVTLVENGRLVHASHPILNWNAENLRFRLAGRGKHPEKASEAEKIDGAAALLTAMACETFVRKAAVTEVGEAVSLRRRRVDDDYDD